MDADIVDRFGRKYVVGDVVAKAEAKRGHPGGINLRRVIQIEDGQLFLDGRNPRPLKLPERCIIVTAIA